MAGTVEHLAVAWELAKRWRRSEETNSLHHICRLDRFLAGNVCPDGIMARKGYTRDMKMHTHFRDGIPDYEFSKPEHLALFHQRIHEFMQRAWSCSSLDRDLYLGFLTHTLTDEYFMLNIRPEFMDKIAVLGLTQRDAKTFEHFTYDVNQIDYRLAAEYPGMDQVYTLLKQVEPYEILDFTLETDQSGDYSGNSLQDGRRIPAMMTREELSDSRRWILSFFFENAPEPEEPVYYTYARGLDFIGEAVEFIENHVDTYL